MKTREQLQNMTVPDLRIYCRENTDHDLTGIEIISLKKSDLIARLTGDNGHKQLELDGMPKDDLASVIANAIQDKIKPDFDIEKVNSIMDEKLQEVNALIAKKIKELDARKHTIEIKNLDTGEVKSVGIQHEKFPEVLNKARLRINCNMVGTAGSGKTYMAEQIAQALELHFYAISVGLQTSKSDLIGYMDANGNYVSTLLRQAFEHGGVFLIDEIDAGNPNVLTVINAMTSNTFAAFPDGMVKKHKDFILLAAANTYGRGGDRQYVGRNPIDGATLDRFAFIDIDIDEKLEYELASNKTWCDRVQKIRKAIFDLKEKVICSPRATINGGLDIDSGTSFEDAENAYIWRGINQDIKDRILERV